MIPILSGNVASALGGAYEVANSCRFDDGSSAYMHKTPGSAGDQQKFTFSFWIKRCALETGTAMTIFDTQADDDNQFKIRFNDNGTLTVESKVSDHNDSLVTTQVFRDPSAWSNFVIAVDTTQGTAGNRVKIYHNGTQITAFGTENYPAENLNTLVNAANKLYVGTSAQTDAYCDMYIAEFCLVDGQQLAATSFGEFDEDSPQIWKPIDVSGLTFGTNGFYLDFEDSSNLGNDANGGTDLTEVNLAATDQSISTPTNIFASGNVLLKRGTSTVSEGNLKIQDSAGAWQGLSTTFGASSGKWYCEWKVTAVNSNSFGVQGEATYSISNDGTAIGFKTPSVSILQNGDRYIDNSGASYAGSFTTNDIIGCAMDLDNHKVYFSKNGAWANGSGAWDSSTFDASVGAISLSQTSGLYFFGHSVHTATSEANYGDPPYTISSSNSDANGYGKMEYAFPNSSYYSLCTKNLAEFG